MTALADSAHPRAAHRAFEAMPKKKGRLADECFDRVAYVILEQRDESMRGALKAMSEDDKSPHQYMAGVALTCLDGGHTGNFRALATRWR
ncbi:MAG: hypothetical protein RIF41_12580 [Polyangiaceae bacterium]